MIFGIHWTINQSINQSVKQQIEPSIDQSISQSASVHCGCQGIYDNTVIVVMSDNGGPITLSSSNYPLRGGKKSIYEGGVRSYTVLKAPGLSATNVIWPGMIHAIDWLPTLVSVAGGKA